MAQADADVRARMRPEDGTWVRLPLKGAVNVRELGGYPVAGGGQTRFRRFLRSDSLARLEASDERFLYDYGVRCVIDLRGEDEVTSMPDCAIGADVLHAWVPLLEFNAADYQGLRERYGSDSNDFELGAIYWLILKNFPAIVEIFHVIATAPEGCVLFHCSVGKDRTGVVAMLLLGLAGVDKWDVVADYVQSFPNLMRDAAYAADYEDSEPFGSREGLESSPASIEFAWDVIERAFGDVRSYLVGCGVSEEDLDAVFARLTQQPAPIPATRHLDHTPIPFMPSASGRTKGGAGACSVCPA